MTDGKFVGDSLEDLLVSLADGVREAQQELQASPAVDEFGRRLGHFHFPYVDFEFEVSLDTVNSQSPGKTILKIAPIRGGGQRSATIKSSVSGRLVAVPPGQGLPRPIVDFVSTNRSATKWDVTLSASNEAGEVLVGHPIELNLNFAASESLSAAAGHTLPEFGSATKLGEAVLTTDASGSATTELTIGTNVPSGAFVVITAELLGESHNHTVGK